MFQYAFGRRIATKNKTPLKLDLSWYDLDPGEDTQRQMSLDAFKIKAKTASEKEIRLYRDNKMFRLINKFRPYYKKSLIKDRRKFDSNLLKTGKRAYLVGDWQSEKYFQDIRDTLLSEFTLKDPWSQTAKSVSKKITNSNSISLHVRRADYVDNPKYQKIYEELSPEYYDKALEILAKNNTDIEIFVFSDDITWAKNNLSFPHPATYVTGEELTDPEEIMLMSLCKHNIIANSSFSWWGAWLNKNPDKLVLAPNKWFKNPNRSTCDIIPDSWIKI